MASSRKKISVTVRLRPSGNGAEMDQWRVKDVLIYHSRPEYVKKVFAFERVFTENDSNEEVFERAVRPAIASVVSGYNATALVYGEEPSGKTRSMIGNDADPGIIRRAVDEIFDLIHKASTQEFIIPVSFLEIDGNRVRDLLGSSRQIENPFKELVAMVVDPPEKIAVTKKEMLHFLAEGEGNRRRNGRPDSIFRITIESSGNALELEERKKCGVLISHLTLVDLAGETGSVALETVVRELASGSDVVNFRSSKLTEMLQNSLGGDSPAVFICNISLSDYESTLSAFRFASNAKRIENKAVRNLVFTEKESCLLRRDKEIQTLSSLTLRVGFGDEQLPHEKEDTISRLRRKIECLEDLSANGEPRDGVRGLQRCTLS